MTRNLTPTIKVCLKIFLVLSLNLPFYVSSSSHANGLFSQIVLKFDHAKSYDYSYNKNTLILSISLKNTDIKEVKPLDYYDESAIRRIVLKQVNRDLDVNITLKRPDLDYIIMPLKDPFRIAIDIYDQTYRDQVDPTTRLPITAGRTQQMPEGKTEEGSFISAPFVSTDSLEAADQQKENTNHNLKYNLVQPLPGDFSAENLKEAISKIPEGPGRGWQEYPLYIYRLSLNTHKGRVRPSGGQRRGNEDRYNAALRSAEFAESQYDYGHEARALFIFQHALNTDPRVFDDDAYYLWALAETQFGQGNISLASAYFKTLQDKHPSSPLSQYAQIRMLDCSALGDEGLSKNESLRARLLQGLALISPKDDPEATALVAIRKGFFGNNPRNKKNDVPIMDAEDVATLMNLIDKVENPRTKYVLSVLTMVHNADSSTPWDKDKAEFSAKFFAEYSKTGETELIGGIRDDLKVKISFLLQKNLDENKFLDTIRIYEELPKSLQSIKKDPLVAWTIAESFRKAGKVDESVGFYQIAATGGDKERVLKAHFWLASISKQTLKNNRQSISKKRRGEFFKIAGASDRSLYSLFKDMSPEAQTKFVAEYRSHLEETIFSRLAIRSVSLIILDTLERNGVPTGPDASVVGEVEPSASSDNFPGKVRLLSLLAKNFAELQMPGERRRTLKLMRQLTPIDGSSDEEAEKTWTHDLVDLAEEYRLASNYLEAGKIYSETASKSQNWEKRHEARYKAGLLLYRAGRHGEATRLLQEACNDGENIFYKNLACERLDQLKN